MPAGGVQCSTVLPKRKPKPEVEDHSGTRTCDARASFRAGCGRSMYYRKALHQRKASLLRCKTVVRRASCGLQHTAGFRVANAWARHCARCLSGVGAARVTATRARRATLVVVCPYPIQGHYTDDRPLSFGARPRCDVPAAACNTQLAFAGRARERATALAVSREEVHHTCLRRARAVPPWL